jgi:uncharacterized membrane protein YgdD (TMEM256/DUF423 family)
LSGARPATDNLVAVTRADLLSFWSAAAQIIPVLALAFVIEARILIRGFSKKRAFKYRASRVRWAAALLVVGTMLFIGELGALSALSVGTEDPLTGIDYFYYWVAYIGMWAALLIVLTIPISNLVNASTRDVRFWLAAHVPWGQSQRLRRRILRNIERAEDIRKGLIDHRFEALMMSADMLLNPKSPDEEDRVITHVLNTVPDGDAEFAAGVRARYDIDPDPNRGYALMRILREMLGEQLRDNKKLRKGLRKSLRQVDSLIAELPPDSEKAIRRLMIEVARAN